MFSDSERKFGKKKNSNNKIIWKSNKFFFKSVKCSVKVSESRSYIKHAVIIVMIVLKFGALKWIKIFSA